MAGLKCIPDSVTASISAATLEFAGVKFKANVVSGTQYIKYIESILYRDVIKQMPYIQRIIICEEKYLFTPDEFKAGTRGQRKTNRDSISHLKEPSEILSENKFDKQSLVTTEAGKSLVSTYLARNASKLAIQKHVLLDNDSEYQLQGCSCSCKTNICQCQKYTTPIRLQFNHAGHQTTMPVTHIKQRGS